MTAPLTVSARERLPNRREAETFGLERRSANWRKIILLNRSVLLAAWSRHFPNMISRPCA